MNDEKAIGSGRRFRDDRTAVVALNGRPDGVRVVEERYEVPPAPRAPSLFPRGSACAYFFKGADYLRYDIVHDTVDVGPAAISRFWHLPEEFQTDIGAAVNWGNGYAYFFKGAGYVRYNIAANMVDVGPTEISRFWTELPPEFHTDIGAVVNWGNGFVYFFKGARYLRYNLPERRVDVLPVEISKYWKELPAEFHEGIDAAVNWGNGFVYFFRGARYLRYNLANKLSDAVDVGPTEIAGNWHLPERFQRDLRAAVNWTFPCDLAALMRAAGLSVNEVGRWRTRALPGGFMPIGIVMHHTGGTNSLDLVVKGDASLAGPRANFHIDKAGVINVVSGGHANHAGPGARHVLDEVERGIAPSATAARRRLRDGPSGNAFFYGFENENRGDGIDPWPEEQLEAMATAASALCQRHCWSADRVISHAEWTSRKIDPTGIDMNDFRVRVAEHF